MLGSMTDAIGRLNAALEGRYSIERELGEGGMATVYLADDLKHDRKVALKVLKPELAAVVGADRFLAEIKTTANLQHPHILPLFDSGEADSFLFYVMPFVDGETLRDRLDREHQLPVDLAVRLTTNVAEALEYAHAHGVIHRDIKPANILLQSGKPVISDFGIALAVGAAGGGRLTETGLSVGTPHYMSPEQATGDSGVGAASDIYALGCVLYEMLVGEPPYTGSTAQAILGKIIAGEAATATKHRTTVPANVDAAIRKALEKVPADRFAGVRDFARALADPGFRHGEMGAAGGGAEVGRWKRRTTLGWGVAAVLALALGGAGVASMNAPASEVSRFVMPFEPGQGFVPGTQGIEFDIAPNGRTFVYVGPGRNGGTQLWVRSLDDLEPRPLAGTDNALSPSFSPDGTSVVFWLAGGYSIASLTGGPLRRIAENRAWDPEWGEDGWVYFSEGRGISRIRETGGDSEQVVQPPEVGDYRFPELLPGGKTLIATHATGAPSASRIVGIPLETGAPIDLVSGGMARYAPSGHLIYAASDGTLLAAALDPDELGEVGTSVVLLQGVQVKGRGASLFAIANEGTLLYRSGAASTGLFNLVWIDRDGRVERVDPNWTFDGSSPNSAGGSEIGLEISPDGTRVALKIHSAAGEDIYVKDLEGGEPSRLTFDPALDRRPRWSPDGEWIVFHSDRGESRDLWRRRADGSGSAELLLDLDRPIIEVQLSPDDEWFVVRLGGTAAVVGGRDIVGVRRGDTTVVPLAADASDEKAAALSPDGRWLAYESTESGRNEIYVIPFPNVNDGKWQVSQTEGISPRWSRTGDELFFVSGDREMTAARVTTEGGIFEVGAKVPLFNVDVRNLSVGENWATYDVADDGRFLMHQFDVNAEVQSRLVLVENWIEELREKVGGN